MNSSTVEQLERECFVESDEVQGGILRRREALYTIDWLKGTVQALCSDSYRPFTVGIFLNRASDACVCTRNPGHHRFILVLSRLWQYTGYPF